MRMVMAAVLAMTASVAMADDIDDAHRLAVSGRELVLAVPRSGVQPAQQQEHVGTGFHGPYRQHLPVRATEFSRVAGGLFVDAIPRRRRRRPYDDGQQGHRAGASRHRERFRQAQGGGEIAMLRGAAAGMMVWGVETTRRDIPMNSETIARVLGAIVGAAALILAFTYAQPWRTAKPDKPVQQIEPSKPQPAAAPAVRGPVVRELPQ